MLMWQYNYSNSDYLQHYGILGMRWGIRRFQDKSGRLTAAGKKRYDDDTSNGSPEKKSSKTSKEVGDSFIEKKLGIKLSDRQKTAIKVGAGIAAAALVAYGGYRLYNSDVGKPLFGGQYAMGGGHSIIYEVSKGKVIFRDGQTGETYRSVREAIGNFVPGKSNYFRMDNLEINNDTIHNAVSTFGLPRVNTNVMEHDPELARNFRQAVLDYRKQYKQNTGYELSLEAARNVIRRYYGVKV